MLHVQEVIYTPNLIDCDIPYHKLVPTTHLDLWTDEVEQGVGPQLLRLLMHAADLLAPR